MRIVAVSELSGYLKALMEEDYFLQDVWVQGEITNYSQSAAGHRYFSLKDEYATLRCVLFRGSDSSAPPMRNGMDALVHGRMSIYEARGDMQFYVDAVEDAGIGVLHQRFEALKARLEAEGLFALERKRPLPSCPAVVGVVTSSSGAALRDILRTLRLRCPLVRVILVPTLVQGDGAAPQVAAALDALNAHGEAEVIIVARGGGSLEELWAFNEEVVAYAIARSRIPVVTGVGHETDFTIADFVADVRSSTPTAAASAVVPDANVWRDMLVETNMRMDQAVTNYLQVKRAWLDTGQRELERASPQRRIDTARQRVDETLASLELRMQHQLAMRRQVLRGKMAQVHALSPLLTLERGYSIVRTEPDGEVVRSVTQAAPGERLRIRVADGIFDAVAGPRSAAHGADVGASDAAASGLQANPRGTAKALARDERKK
jgi:exodeoxyribonuclease VII large subunit